MKIRYLLIVIWTIQHISAFSQKFEVKDSLQLQVDHVISGQWADVNNDGSLEYVTLLKAGDSIVVSSLTIGNGALTQNVLFSKVCLSAHFEMADFTKDGRLDILLSTKTNSGNSLEIYTNNDALDFEAEVTKIDSIYAHRMVSADYTRNGMQEILAITENNQGEFEPKIYAYKNKTMSWDTLLLPFSDELIHKELLNIDIDNNGWSDILISGLNSANEPVLELFENMKGKFEKTDHSFDYHNLLKMSKADLDADGDFEIIYYGNAQSDSSLYYYENESTFFKKDNFGTNPDSVQQFFAADFNSDGFSDVILKSTTTGEEKIELMLNDGNMNFTLEELTQADYQGFGDWDWDGDLDIIQFRGNVNGVKVVLLDNITVDVNNGPADPTEAFAFPQLKSVTINWDSVLDDHTNQAAITYDLYIKKEGLTVSPGFYIENPYRIITAHGNQNTLTTAAYYDLEPGVYEYGIQTVDNAFYARGCSGGGSGSGGGDILRRQFVICENNNVHSHTVCEQEEVLIVAPDNKNGEWFSSVRGHLGASDSLKLVITESEQIYFSVQNSTACEDQEVWTFDVSEGGEVDQLPDVWACEGQLLEFKVGDFWKSVQWKSGEEVLSEANSIGYQVSQQDIIMVNMESHIGCTFTDVFSINISVPEVTLSGEIYRILKGKSVQITASGGVNYEWTPHTGLNDPYSPTPIASPEKTTDYTVLVSDSLGCTVMSNVKVIVETSAFVPNLFTPNLDQKNDALKIYGLEEVDNFTFKIYNRSGSLVFESNDINEVVVRGWDGTKRGKKQPNGVYYWKISGVYKNGNTVYLNGESSGAVHLLR